MKYYIHSFIILLILGGCAVTEDTTRIDREYALQNDSGFNIKINFLQPDGVLINEVLILAEGQQSNFKEIDGSRSLLNNDESFLSVWVSQNVNIIFNNEKVLFQNADEMVYSNPLNRNIYRIGNYESIGNDQFVFTFTQEDYENATPCDGPCE